MEKAFFFGLYITDFALVLACLYYGPKARNLCLAALWLNAIPLALSLLLIAYLVANVPSHSEGHIFTFIIAACFAFPLFLAFLSLLAIYLWRVGPRHRVR